jgi:hypothetical protein
MTKGDDMPYRQAMVAVGGATGPAGRASTHCCDPVTNSPDAHRAATLQGQAFDSSTVCMPWCADRAPCGTRRGLRQHAPGLRMRPFLLYVLQRIAGERLTISANTPADRGGILPTARYERGVKSQRRGPGEPGDAAVRAWGMGYAGGATLPCPANLPVESKRRRDACMTLASAPLTSPQCATQRS